MAKLTTIDHDRGAAGLRYVYPVVSRRAGGVSVGINLNPNNACNWRCVYCQVPDLVRGAAPEIDRALLREELDGFLRALFEGDWLEQRVEPEHRVVKDVAFSGNGEPTTARPFDGLVDDVLDVLQRHGRLDTLNKVLITNGSMMQREEVQRGVARLGEAGGEVWFKLDSATSAGREALNGTPTGPETARRNLRLAASRCRTRIQTCVVALDGSPPSDAEQTAYLDFLTTELNAGTPLHDVLLYGLARPSHQDPEGRVSKVDDAWLGELADRIRAVGLAVRVST